ncbi:MAG TPA: hypothetical protein VIV60_35855, partial [Polyangiaceae bacterium]
MARDARAKPALGASRSENGWPRNSDTVGLGLNATKCLCSGHLSGYIVGPKEFCPMSHHVSPLQMARATYQPKLPRVLAA